MSETRSGMSPGPARATENSGMSRGAPPGIEREQRDISRHPPGLQRGHLMLAGAGSKGTFDFMTRSNVPFDHLQASYTRGWNRGRGGYKGPLFPMGSEVSPSSSLNSGKPGRRAGPMAAGRRGAGSYQP